MREEGSACSEQGESVSHEPINLDENERWKSAVETSSVHERE